MNLNGGIVYGERMFFLEVISYYIKILVVVRRDFLLRCLLGITRDLFNDISYGIWYCFCLFIRIKVVNCII